MRKAVLTVGMAILSFCAIWLLVVIASVDNQVDPFSLGEYVPDEVLVKFKPDIDKEAVRDTLASVEAKIVTYLGEEIETTQWKPDIAVHSSFPLDSELFHLRVPEHVGTEQAVVLLRRSPLVKYAEPNGIWHVCVDPNDPEYNRLWGLKNTGQAGGTIDADIDAPEAWNIFSGTANTIVAVIDSGCDYSHLDLSANIWSNDDEVPGNGRDDDNNGYIDDIRGWDFVSNDNNPMDENDQPPERPTYHGTHVSGTIGARGNNGIGVVGVNWNVKMMIVRAADRYGVLTSGRIVNAVDYATTNGAHISNNSYSGSSYSQTVFYAIYRNREAGRVFVAAAGNDGINIDGNPRYPACYLHDNIVAVAATTNQDGLAPRSNWGPNTVDLGAPGGMWQQAGETPGENDIYSTKKNNAYQYLHGTSMATPHVTGVAALLRGYRTDVGHRAIIYGINQWVDPKGSLNGKTVTGGRLNAYTSLQNAPSLPSLPAAPSNLTATGHDEQVELHWQDNSNNEEGFLIYRKSGNEFYEFDRVGPNVTSYWDTELPCGQRFCYKVRAFNWGGHSAATPSRCALTDPCK